MTTLHVDLGPRWRGGQNQAWLLMKGLRARGHVAELLAGEDSPLARRAQAEGIRVHAVGQSLLRLRAALELRRLLAQRRFDILHLHEAHALTAAWLAGAHCRTGVVASRRVAYPLQSQPWGVARYRAAHRVLAISHFVADSVTSSRLPPEQIAIVYSGIEVPPQLTADARRQARARWGAEENVKLLGCVGYLLREKGQGFLIRALPAVQAQFPTCRLLLAGDGPCRPRWQELARALGVAPVVQFAGHVEDVSQVYAALDVFLFPSSAEPLGTSLLSAMAYGLPCAAVAAGAVPEVVEDGRNGLLVPEAQPAAFAAAIGRLLGDTQLATQLGAAARKTVEERFTADHMVENTLRIYREVCAAEGRR